MNETDILHTLERACQGLDLIFQVVQETETLYIYINRPPEPTLQHEQLAVAIQEAIATLEIPHLKTLCLYSRVLGTVEPDWETVITLPSAETNAPEQHSKEKVGEAIAQSPTKQEREAISALSEDLETSDPGIDLELNNTDLSQYCFTRNRSLLTSEILPPNESIARLLQHFHALDPLNKQQALPCLDNFFKASNLPPLQDLDPQTQAWLHQLGQINPADLRKTAIWMSRYCLNPEPTMEQVKGVLPAEETKFPSAAIASGTISQQPSSQDTLSQPSTVSLEMYSTVAPVRPRTVSAPKITPPEVFPSASLAPQKNQQSLGRYALLVPLIWLLCTVTLIVIDIQSQKNPQVSETFCQTASSQPYCQLAVQLVGAEKVQRFQKETAAEPAMVEGVKEKSVTDCQLVAYFNSGYTMKDGLERDTTKLPDIKMQQETVFPGLFMVDIQLANKTGETVRTACAYSQGIDPVMLRERPSKLAASVIPTDWPEEPFENKTYRNTSQASWSILNLLRNLGINTLATAIGLLVVVYFGLGIEVDSLTTLYKAAFVLGISETVTELVPIFGFLRFTVVQVLALLLTSLIVKDLKLDWAIGYKVIASGALAIIAIRALLHWLLFFTITSFMV